MKEIFKPIIAALIFATAIILSAYFFKHNPIRSWLDSGIYIAGVYCLFQYFRKPATCCVTKTT
jgi:hypothetical protein